MKGIPIYSSTLIQSRKICILNKWQKFICWLFNIEVPLKTFSIIQIKPSDLDLFRFSIGSVVLSEDGNKWYVSNRDVVVTLAQLNPTWECVTSINGHVAIISSIFKESEKLTKEV